MEYIDTGSTKSLKKYRMILELNKKIEHLLDWGKFLEEIKNYRFIQVAITEIGNIKTIKIIENNVINKNLWYNY